MAGTLSYLESGNRFVVEGTFTGTHTGPLVSPQGEIPASGKAFEVRYADFFDVKDGKITSHRVYYDQVELMTQLGLMPQPGQPRT